MKKVLAALTVAAFAVLGLAGAAHASVRPVHRFCSQLMTFNLPHLSHVYTETQGPWLRVNEVFAYQGDTYVITSVTHTGFVGHDRFTASLYGTPVTNFGPSIRHGEAHLVTC